MVFKVFESVIFSKLKESKRSEQSNDDVKYNSFGYDTHELSKSCKDVSSDLNDTDNTDNKLFTPIKERTRLNILSPKQMLQRLPIAFAQVKAGNNSENLLNEIRQIVYSLYQ